MRSSQYRQLAAIADQLAAIGDQLAVIADQLAPEPTLEGLLWDLESQCSARGIEQNTPAATLEEFLQQPG